MYSIFYATISWFGFRIPVRTRMNGQQKAGFPSRVARLYHARNGLFAVGSYYLWIARRAAL